MIRLIKILDFMIRNTKKNVIISTSSLPGQQSSSQEVLPRKDQFSVIKKKLKDLDQKSKKYHNAQNFKQQNSEEFENMFKGEEVQNQKVKHPKIKLTLQDKMKNLQVPDDLVKLKNPKLPLPKDLKQRSIKETQKDDDQNIIWEESKQVNDDFTLMSDKELEQKQKMDILMAKQDIILEEIKKNSKQKQLKINSKGKQKFLSISKQEQLLYRYQKAIQALESNKDPSQVKFDGEDLLKMKYSAQIIEKAKEFKNQDLGYFKRLIINDEKESEYYSVNERKFKNQYEKGLYDQKKRNSKVLPVVTENNYLNSKTQEGLVAYEDIDFYRKKAEKQIKQAKKLSQIEKNIIESGNLDLKMGNKISNIFIQESHMPQYSKQIKKQIYDKSSFGIEQKKRNQITKRLQSLGINFKPQDINAICKQDLFSEKQLRQEQISYQKYLLKKNKKAQMKKELKKIHENRLRDDLNFDKQEQKIMTIKQVKQSLDYDQLEQNLQKIQKMNEQKQSVISPQTREDRKTQIHRKKTFVNMESFLTSYFANGFCNHNTNQLEDVQIISVIPNRSNTVLNVFWDLDPKYLAKVGLVEGANQYQVDLEKQRKKMQQRLKKQGTYISGKMTQVLGLRYGPEIRFYFDLKTERTKEAAQELSRHVKEIAMLQVEDLKEKGKINSQSEERVCYQRMVGVAKNNIIEFNNRKLLLSKKFRKQIKSENWQQSKKKQKEKEKMVKKKVRKYKIQMEDEEAIQKPIKNKIKQAPVDKLWNTIDLL